MIVKIDACIWKHSFLKPSVYYMYHQT
jgi:hypothetical protein